MRGPRFFRLKAGRRDSTQKAIATGLRKLGYLVVDLAGAGSGTADLLVFTRLGRPCFIEVKAGKGKLRESQRDFARRVTSYDVAYGVARTLDEALHVVGHDVRSRVEANAARVDRIAAETLALWGGE